eukprot:112936_1
MAEDRRQDLFIFICILLYGLERIQDMGIFYITNTRTHSIIILLDALPIHSIPHTLTFASYGCIKLPPSLYEHLGLIYWIRWYFGLFCVLYRTAPLFAVQMSVWNRIV